MTNVLYRTYLIVPKHYDKWRIWCIMAWHLIHAISIIRYQHWYRFCNRPQSLFRILHFIYVTLAVCCTFHSVVWMLTMGSHSIWVCQQWGATNMSLSTMRSNKYEFVNNGEQKIWVCQQCGASNMSLSFCLQYTSVVMIPSLNCVNEFCLESWRCKFIINLRYWLSLWYLSPLSYR